MLVKRPYAIHRNIDLAHSKGESGYDGCASTEAHQRRAYRPRQTCVRDSRKRDTAAWIRRAAMLV